MPHVPGTFENHHEWVIVGTFEIQVDDHEAKRIVEDPTDIAVMFRRAKPVKVTGPGCSKCGLHASVAWGTTCTGRVAEAVLAESNRRELEKKIWTPPT